jgi:type II restriction/modification system DNA methylase subunit YeeA
MDTNKLKKFAQDARTLLIAQVTSKLGLVLAEGSAARREAGQAVRVLEAEIKATSEKQVVEKVAYTWFNRFTALRFMDANGYTNPRIVTPADGQTRPEILADAAAGHMPDDIPDQIRNAVTALLDGRTPSRDAQGEAYRLLLVAGCNQWHGPMPFLFETIADYTELLMPEDLLSDTSILASLRKAMTDDDCKDVEIIGWLYQFYISEKKDQVFAGLKKNIKITAENIPAATQLFTPHWIVRYLVENSLGRLWLLNRPASKLAAQMDYYIAPEEPETDFLRITKPEDIRICDPAAGSGHMLTYAFDLLHAIYEEEGYQPTEIPALILTHNLHGVEIDDRAGALAAFALVMKAAAKLGRRRFLRLGVQPNICVMQDVRFTPAEMQDVAAVVGRDLFTAALRETLGQFEQAKNFGSLIVPKLRDPAEVARVVRLKDFGGDLLLRDVQERVLKVLEMAEALSPKYHVVVANPPYMGGKGMNGAIAGFLKEKYSDVKSDLFSAFIVRNTKMALPKGQLGFMTPFVWMFISTYEKLRFFLLQNKTITSLVQLEYSGFDGATVPICTFTIENSHRPSFKGGFIRLSEFRGSENQGPKTLEAIKDPTCEWFHRAAAEDFGQIPGGPIAYWVSKSFLRVFSENSTLGNETKARQGLATGDNGQFARVWHEVAFKAISLTASSCEETLNLNEKWYPYNKGGPFRRWYGNLEWIVDWQGDGQRIRNFKDENGKVRSRPQNTDCYFQSGITWSDVTSGYLSVRSLPKGAIYDISGHSAFPREGRERTALLAYLNTKFAKQVAKMLNPTLHFQIGDYQTFPYPKAFIEQAVPQNTNTCVSISRSDWDAYETSWDFTTLPLLAPEHRDQTLAGSFARLRAHWQGMTDEMQRLEEENNRIFIDAYGLADELTPDVPLEEITLTCNPAYRYGSKAEDLETRLRADTMAEFLHYAVGCMFGRYSLDAPGLILANQGEGLADYLARIPEPSFDMDADNVIPVLDADWFADDITERFRKFLRVTFGEAQFQENLAFVEDALGKDIRKYFTKDFFEAHVRRYKKRPIYWMFSSPKGTFNALIYMHRYRPDTVSVVLNDYLREFISKLQSERLRLEKLADDMSASQSQRTKAQKDVAVVAKQLEELISWERDVVFPLAQAKIEIDLDDGVKANYPKFGAALKFIKGLEASEDE